VATGQLFGVRAANNATQAQLFAVRAANVNSAGIRARVYKVRAQNFLGATNRSRLYLVRAANIQGLPTARLYGVRARSRLVGTVTTSVLQGGQWRNFSDMQLVGGVWVAVQTV
jgi:hypothetical protein